MILFVGVKALWSTVQGSKNETGVGAVLLRRHPGNNLVLEVLRTKYGEKEKDGDQRA